MAYENLTYTSIAGEMTATYNDNNMRRSAAASPATGPGLLMTATARSGLDVQAFRAAASEQATQDAAREFNVNSDITRVLAAAQSISGDQTPLTVMRIGAKPFHMFLEKGTSGLQEKEAWIKITPFITREEDSEEGVSSTQDQLGLILMPFREGSLIRQRAVIFNTTTARVVFDSEGLLVDAIAEALFDVELNVPAGYFLYTPDTFESNILGAGGTVTLDEIHALADVKARMQTSTSINLSGFSISNGQQVADGYLDKINIVDEFALENFSLRDFNAANIGDEILLRTIGGSNGDFISHCERYAANEIAYDELEFENLAFLHCDKCYADIGPVELTADMSLKDQASWQKYKLGYMWKYEFNGRPYVFLSARLNPFTSGDIAAEYTYDGIKYKLSADQRKLGDALNLVEFHLHPLAQGSATEVESFSDEKGLIQCHVSFDCDPAGLPKDGFGRDEAAFEAYATAGFIEVDARGRNAVDFAALVAFDDQDNDTFDDVTGLIAADHAAYLAAGFAGSGSNAEALTQAQYDAYVAAGHQAAIVVETPFATLEINTQRFDTGDDPTKVRLRPSMIGGTRTLSTYALQAPDRIELDPFFMTHFDLTGNLIPEAVINRILTFTDPVYAGTTLTQAGSASLIAKNVEVREVSFLHQSATAAYKASTNYSQTIAVVPTSPPSRSRNGISSWAGNPATYEVQTNGDVTVTENGTGVLGTKLLAGAVGYRGSAAFGGIILTNGDLLPNGIPYGIDDTDEALDAMGNPIDLGKHVIVVGAYGLINNPASTISTNGRRINVGAVRPYVSSAGPMIAGLLSVLEPGTEPIGPIRGRIAGFNAQQRTPRAVLDNLAALRICMIDQTGVISSIYTAALRTSDYTKVSSILAANAILARMRSECMTVIGTAYTDQQISSLAQRLDGVSRALVQQGYAQQLSTQLRGSQLDRINGIVRLSVRFIPPLSIEAISIDLTLEPPASGI